MNKPLYLATGLRLGLVEPNDVQIWVDAEIKNSEMPSDELLSLAHAKDTDIHGMYSTLMGLAGDSDEYEAVRVLLQEIENSKLDSINFCWRLTECLYSIWVEHDYSAPDDLSEIGLLEDEYRLACNGTYGTLEGWHVKFKEYIFNVKKHN